jgi:FkbM family methyltransferase
MPFPTPKALLARLISLAGYDIRKRVPTPREKLLGLCARPIRTVIDVGANEGQFAREVRAALPGTAIYSFEPLPDVFSTLQAWTKTQRDVRAFNVALGETDATMEFRICVEHHYSSSLLRSTPLNDATFPQTKNQTTAKVPVRTLDGWIEEQGLALEPELLIKLDVQGYEDRVIAGGAHTFGRAAACILEVNIDALYEGQARFVDLVGKLDALGLRYAGNLDQAHAPDGHVIFLDAVFVR